LVFLDGQLGERGRDGLQEQLHVPVVALVVLDHRGVELVHVVLVGGLPRLAAAERRILGCLLRESPQDEVQLDRDRLLAPEGAVVVEDPTRSSSGMRSAALSANETIASRVGVSFHDASGVDIRALSLRLWQPFPTGRTRVE
jgi:hypothetical protein